MARGKELFVHFCILGTENELSDLVLFSYVLFSSIRKFIVFRASVHLQYHEVRSPGKVVEAFPSPIPKGRSQLLSDSAFACSPQPLLHLLRKLHFNSGAARMWM